MVWIILLTTQIEISQIVEKEEIFIGKGPHKLNGYGILWDSINLFIKNRKISEKEYQVEKTKATFYIHSPSISEEDTIVCSYSCISFTLAKKFTLNKIKSPTSTCGKNNKKIPPPFPPPDTCSSLTLYGTNNFSFTIGNDFSPYFHQSLCLQVKGEMEEGLKVEGVVQDEGNSIEGNGFTEKLSNIEEIYFAVTKKENKITIGDIKLTPSFTLGKIERKVKGIEVKKGGGQFSLGRGKGRWERVEIMGEFKKQGPYKIEKEGIIIEGTECVWVNHQLLERGKDYVINYGLKEITFTPQRIIRENDRIIIEMQMNKQVWRRGNLSGKYKVGGINLVVFREEDFTDNPEGVEISEKMKEMLKKEKKDVGWIDGGKYVGKGRGSYIKKDSIYEYVGLFCGDYEVQFSYKEGGNYIFDDTLQGYRYVGEGKGNYVPQIQIPLPQATTIMQLEYKGKVGGIELGGEMIGGEFNSNLFSERKGEKKVGIIGEVKKKISNSVEVGIRGKHIDEKFPFPGNRVDTIEGKVYENFIKTIINKKSYIELKYSSLPVEKMKSLVFTLSPKKFPQIEGSFLSGDKSRIYYLGVRYKGRKFTPYASVREERKEYFSNRCMEKIVGIELNPGGFRFKNNYSNSHHTNMYKIWVKGNFLTLFYSYNQQLYPSTSSFGVGFLKIQKEKKRKYKMKINYELNSVEHIMYKEEYYRVKEGEGNFSRDTITGEYYFNPTGNYERKVVPMEANIFYKSFTFNHHFQLFCKENLILKLETSKKGLGEEVSFWQKSYSSPLDKNVVKIGGTLHDLTYCFTQSEERKVGGKVLPFTTLHTTHEIHFTPSNFEFNYSQVNLIKKEGIILVWSESGSEVGVGFTSNYPKNFTSTLTFSFLMRKIISFPYSGVKFPSISLELFTTSPSKHKKISSSSTITYHFTPFSSPPSIKFLYPRGFSFSLTFSYSLFATGNKDYFLTCSLSKTPISPLSPLLNFQVDLKF